jgi:hypothetical protein
MRIFFLFNLTRQAARRLWSWGLSSILYFQEEWLSRRKRFASRRYSERNVDSMPPPSPYQPMMMNPGGVGGGLGGHDLPDGRVPPMDHRPVPSSTGSRTRRTRKKDCVFVIYWNLLRWLFWVSLIPPFSFLECHLFFIGTRNRNLLKFLSFNSRYASNTYVTVQQIHLEALFSL